MAFKTFILTPKYYAISMWILLTYKCFSTNVHLIKVTIHIQRMPRPTPVGSPVASCRSIHAAVPDADSTISSSLQRNICINNHDSYSHRMKVQQIS